MSPRRVVVRVVSPGRHPVTILDTGRVPAAVLERPAARTISPPVLGNGFGEGGGGGPQEFSGAFGDFPFGDVPFGGS